MASSSMLIHKTQRRRLEGGYSTHAKSCFPEAVSDPLRSRKLAIPLPDSSSVNNSLKVGRGKLSPTMPSREEINVHPPAEKEVSAVARRRKSHIPDVQYTNPSHSGGSKVQATPLMADQQQDGRVIRRPDAAPQRALRKRPRRPKASANNIAQADIRNERESSCTSAACTRRAEAENYQELELEDGDFGRNRKFRSYTDDNRRHKLNVSEATITSSLPESCPLEAQICNTLYPTPYWSSATTLTTKSNENQPLSPPSLNASSVGFLTMDQHCADIKTPETSDVWLQILVDIFMWRNIARSTLLFGFGCFCICSSSVMQEMQFSAISILAHSAFVYIASMYLKRTFLRGATSGCVGSESVHILAESDALKLIRVLLPPMNGLLSKLAMLFSGEPTITLKVAGALWLLAQSGYIMNLWTFARLAYFSLFIIPKCYSSYSDQIHGHVMNLLSWARSTWDACNHKKLVLFVAFFLAWNLSSVSTRICWAFITLVALRAYQHVLRAELENGNFDTSYVDKTFDARSYGLVLITRPQLLPDLSAKTLICNVQQQSVLHKKHVLNVESEDEVF